MGSCLCHVACTHGADYLIYTIFVIAASGVVVFVPMYKNMSRMTNADKDNRYTLLGNIDTPAQLRELPVGQLPQLCGEIRQFLIEALSSNPGHFASSMGAVELTVALHYVFDTPYDRLVWDVGHQAYGHKLLTGRRDSFCHEPQVGWIEWLPRILRKANMIPSRPDMPPNSTLPPLEWLSLLNLKAESPRRNVVAVIGDASISGGPGV